jgi:hypothetical protein
MFDTITQAILCQDTLQKITIGFAILRADGTDGQRLRDIKAYMGLRIFSEKLGNDTEYILILKNKTVLAQSKGCSMA